MWLDETSTVHERCFSASAGEVRQTAVTTRRLGVGDDSDGAQQLVDGVDEVLVSGRDALDARRCHGRHRQVIQVRVELHPAHAHARSASPAVLLDEGYCFRCRVAGI